MMSSYYDGSYWHQGRRITRRHANELLVAAEEKRRRKKDAIRKRNERARESWKQRVLRLSKDRVRHRIKLKHESPEHRRQRLEKRRERYRKSKQSGGTSTVNNKTGPDEKKLRFHDLFLQAMGRAPGNQTDAKGRLRAMLIQLEGARALRLIWLKRERQRLQQSNFLRAFCGAEYLDPDEIAAMRKFREAKHRQDQLFSRNLGHICYSSLKLIPSGLANWWSELQKCPPFAKLPHPVKVRAKFMAEKHHLDRMSNKRRSYDQVSRSRWWQSDAEEFYKAFPAFQSFVKTELSKPTFTTISCCDNDFCPYK